MSGLIILNKKSENGKAISINLNKKDRTVPNSQSNAILFKVICSPMTILNDNNNN